MVCFLCQHPGRGEEQGDSVPPVAQPQPSRLIASRTAQSPRGETTPAPHPRASPGPTHVLASLPPYIRWASFSSNMSQYLLQNSVTSLPWSFTAFMGG